MIKTSNLNYSKWFIIMVISLSCDPGTPIDSKAVKEEIQSRKLEKLHLQKS